MQHHTVHRPRKPYTIRFRGYSAAKDDAAAMASGPQPWAVMDFSDIHFYQSLFKKYYEINGGLDLLNSWSSSGCWPAG